MSVPSGVIISSTLGGLISIAASFKPPGAPGALEVRRFLDAPREHKRDSCGGLRLEGTGEGDAGQGQGRD